MNRSFVALLALGLAVVACSDTSSVDEDVAETTELHVGTVRSGLIGVASFGSNPAKLTMAKYVPEGMPNTPRPLVVALHGCSQSPDAYAAAGWNELADAWKFYVVYPGQNNGRNNSLGCFNWGGRWPSAPNAFVFTPESLDLNELKRGNGENESIKEMVDNMKKDHAVDASRVFVTGLSAGGGMAAVMLATWPDVFSAGAIMAGIPYGCATNKKTTEEANNCLKAYSGTNAYLSRTPSAWGDLVRAASAGSATTFPRVSIWGGTADGTVAPAIIDEHVKQWTNVHGADLSPDVSNTVDGYPHEEFHDKAGRVVVESYKITGKSHGTMVAPTSPVDPGMPSGPKCGKAGAFILSAGICSTYHAAKFFGLGPPGSEPTGNGGSSGAPGSDGGAAGTPSGNGGSAATSSGGAAAAAPRRIGASAASTCTIGIASRADCNFALGALGALSATVAVRRRFRTRRPLS